MDVVVTCRCGWATTGSEEHVIEAMQVHARQIHGMEMTCGRVLSLAKPASSAGLSSPRTRRPRTDPAA